MKLSYKYAVAAIVFGSVFVLEACQKNMFWVGEGEYLTFTYSNYDDSEPTLSNESDDKSPFIYFESTTTQKLGNGRVRLSINGVSVKTMNKVFEISDLKVKEKENGKLRETFNENTEIEDNVKIEKSDLAVVILIDMTRSMKDKIADTKQVAKDFVDVICDSSENANIAVIFFSGKDKIDATIFYPTVAREILKNQIDNYATYGDQTALFAATETAIKMLDNLNFEGSKSIILFSDGPDTDTDKPDSALIRIQNSSYERMAIGIQSKDFKRWDLLDMATAKSTCYIVDEPADLKDYFAEISSKLTSKYNLIYERSDQILDKEILIKYLITTNKTE